MGPRWKGKDSEAKALKDPMSKIVLELQSSLIQSESRGILCGCSVLLAAEVEQAVLLHRACFGEPITAAEKDKQWFQLGLEEAFYLCNSLKCLVIVGEDKRLMNVEELWLVIKSKKPMFPDFYKGYSHLRMKNWVVKSGSRYGVDFVAYRHHPALVHSEFAVLVLTEGEVDVNARLRMWSDVHSTTRLCGGVVKTLLVLNINKNGQGSVSPSCIKKYTVDELTIKRWSSEKCREDHTVAESETDNHTVIENITK